MGAAVAVEHGRGRQTRGRQTGPPSAHEGLVRDHGFQPSGALADCDLAAPLDPAANPTASPSTAGTAAAGSSFFSSAKHGSSDQETAFWPVLSTGTDSNQEAAFWRTAGWDDEPGRR